MRKSFNNDETRDLTNLMYKFMTSRRRSVLRLTDLWSLTKLQHPDHPIVKYWKSRNKEKHGVDISISKALSKDPRFFKLKVPGKRDVYYTLLWSTL